MHTHKFKLIRVIEDLRNELQPSNTYSTELFTSNRYAGKEVCIKYYKGDEIQKKPFNLDVAENTQDSNTQVQTHVTKDGKTVKVVTGAITIKGSVKTPDGLPSIVLYVPSKEEDSSYAYEYYGELGIRRTVIYEDNKRHLTFDIIENKEEILSDMDNYYQEVMAWWNMIYSKIKESTGPAQPSISEDGSDEANPEEPSLLEDDSHTLQYCFPNLDLLNHDDNSDEPTIDKEEQLANKNKIVKVLNNFGIEISEIRATVGHAVTRYEVFPAKGVRISKIRNLEDDIALNISAIGVRIIAPIPGRGTIGIEMSNNTPELVSMRSLLGSKKFQESKMELPVAMGKTIDNEVFMFDLTKIPHLLIAGSTGQGKTVGLNTIITSLLYKKRPDEMKLVLIDPKKVELSMYEPIARHFMPTKADGNEVIITKVSEAVRTLKSLGDLMDHRYDLLKMANARNIKDYNQKILKNKLNPAEGHEYMPYIVVVIDEFGDLIMRAGMEIELPIVRIAQLSRAVGIHLVISTQRPLHNIITGNIKANFPGRMAFRVCTRMDSLAILDRPGANQLIGRGDMLFLNDSEPVRVQCAFIDEKEVEKVCNHIARQPIPSTPLKLVKSKKHIPSESQENMQMNSPFLDPLFEHAARFIFETQVASVSMLQRQFSIGFNRAGRLMEQLESAGIIEQAYHEILVDDEEELETIIEQIKAKGVL